MRTLPDTFKKYGSIFTIERRTVDKAIYSRDGGESYEVIKIKNSPTRKIGSTLLEAGEYYPSAEQWGTYGFTYTNLKDALNKYDEL